MEPVCESDDMSCDGTPPPASADLRSPDGSTGREKHHSHEGDDGSGQHPQTRRPSAEQGASNGVMMTKSPVIRAELVAPVVTPGRLKA